MARFRFAVEYFGEPYAGWQVQNNAITVQGELERALETVLRVPVRLTGAGRTDAGVHASGQVAHFDSDAPFEPRKLEHSLNALAGPHIKVRGLEACSETFHARFDATSRRYRYRLALRPVALMAPLSWQPPWPFDLAVFEAELKSALGKRDFLSFSVPRDDGKSTRCDLRRVELVREGALLEVWIEADRFLHKMVRSLLGAALDAARGAPGSEKVSLADGGPGLIRSILDGSFDGPRFWAPPGGLCLERVAYPDYEAP
jgi:tRNA pseudouridine38-40 synthase